MSRQTITSNGSQTASIDGIEIHSPYLAHYLEILAHVIVNQFGDHLSLNTARQQIGDIVGYFPEPLGRQQRSQVDFAALPYVIGWFHHDRLEQLLHREWLRSDTNEFDAHIELLDGLESLRAVQSIAVVGAGTCRMAEYLHARSADVDVVCSDLSYLAIHFGRMMMRGRSHELPAPLCRERKFWRIDGSRIIPTLEPLEYLQPTHLAETRYEVGDICDAMGTTMSADLVCAMYLLDAHPTFEPMLIRMTTQMKVHQRLVLLTTINPERDPESIVALLEVCGFSIDALHIQALPYSFSRHDGGLAQLVGQTFVVEATKSRDSMLETISVLPTVPLDQMRAVAARPLVPNQRHFPVELDRRTSEILVRAMNALRYPNVLGILQSELGQAQANRLLTWLISRCMLHFRREAN